MRRILIIAIAATVLLFSEPARGVAPGCIRSVQVVAQLEGKAGFNNVRDVPAQHVWLAIAAYEKYTRKENPPWSTAMLADHASGGGALMLGIDADMCVAIVFGPAMWPAVLASIVGSPI